MFSFFVDRSAFVLIITPALLLLDGEAERSKSSSTVLTLVLETVDSRVLEYYGT